MVTLETLIQLAKGIAGQYGTDCEIVIHQLLDENPEHASIAYIENGHVTGRSAGDGASHIVLETLAATEKPVDRYGYLTRTRDGRILKSTTLYIQNEEGRIHYILGINHDITNLLAGQTALHSLLSLPEENAPQKPEKITTNVEELLTDLMEQSVALIGKPTALMTKEEKITALNYLNDSGAFLITRSAEKIAAFFGISKYTLYSYVDIKNQKK